MAGVPHGGNMWKNIAIGIFTTVAAYLIVNLITKNKGTKQEFKKKKEATIGVWQSLLKSNRYYYEDFYSAVCSATDKEAQATMAAAIDKQISDYELLQKQADLDNDMGLFINRFLTRLKDLKRHMTEYFEATEKNELNPTLTAEEKQILTQKTDSIYLPRIQQLNNQDTSSINNLMRGMVEKYGDNFPQVTLFPALTEEALIGEWLESEIRLVHFKKNNELEYTEKDSTYLGKWSLQDNKIKVNWNGNTDTYHAVLATQRFIRFRLNDEEEERQFCRQ
jgi:hypothetical protein